MTIDKARELIKVQANLGGGYNSNAVKLILAEVRHSHGQQAVDSIIKEFELERIFGLHVGTSFARPV